MPSRKSSLDEEKASAEAADYSPEKALTLEDPATRYDPEFIRKTMRKVDLRLLPILGALYSLGLIDRINLANARVAGAGDDLGLTIGDRYTIVSLIFFPTLIIFELPSNIVLRKVGPAIWISLIAVLFGLVMLCMGFVKTWDQLAALRALLGAFESGFFPGCAYLIQTWYIRREVQKRLAAFYLCSILVGAFANILATGLSEMKGLRGLNGWQWIFIIEGMLTILVGIISYFFIVDFPDKNKFLTPEETELVKARINYDRGDAEPDVLTWGKVGRCLIDLKLWAYGMIMMGAAVPGFAFSYFLPIILAGMGYNSRDSQLLSAPPFVVAIVFAMIVAILSDKYQHRGGFVIVGCIVCVVGLAMTAYGGSNATRYAGTFLGLTGSQMNVPAALAWQANNIIGQSKRTVSSVMIATSAAIGGIVASVAFRQADAPTYVPGLWTSIAFQFLVIIIVTIAEGWFYYRNKQIKQGSTNYIQGRPGFLYTL